MAKRRRLIPAAFGQGLDPDLAAGIEAQGPPPSRPGLAPGLVEGASAPLTITPPIARVAAEASVQAALDEVANAMASARAEGRMVLALPLGAIELTHLVRDRIALDEEELEGLIASIREHGQRMPIEVTNLGNGRYGLISGWRRMQALLRLAQDEQKFGSVLALLRKPADASSAYIAMVEENEVRQSLSYYERARIAARAVDLGVFDSEKAALQRLFASASRARRSKIGSFLSLYRALDPALQFPAAIPERLGLALAKAIGERPDELGRLSAALAVQSDLAAEQAVLAHFAAGKTGSNMAERPPAPKPQEVAPGVFLAASGGEERPVLTLSGPAVDPAFRARLENWLEGQ